MLQPTQIEEAPVGSPEEVARRSYWRELNAGEATASEAGAVADVDAGLGDKARRYLHRYICRGAYHVDHVDHPETSALIIAGTT